jgi:hypothetical protein
MNPRLTGKEKQGRRSVFLRCLTAACAFGLLWAWFLLQGYRETDNLGYVFVRASGGSLASDRLSVVGVSPWNTKSVLSFHPSRGWGLPDGSKRFLVRLQVAPSTVIPGEESVSLAEIAREPWEISVATGLPRVWRPASVHVDSDFVSLELPPAGLAGSFLSKRRHVINWMGDARLFGYSALRSLLLLGMVSLLFALVRWSRCLWFTRGHLAGRCPLRPGSVESAPRSRLVPALPILLLTAALLFGAWGSWQMTRTLWPGLHDDGTLYTTTILNRAAGRGNTFDVYSPALLWFCPGSNEVRAHGQLYQAVLASLVEAANYGSLLELIHRMNLLTFLLGFPAFLMASRRILSCSWIAAGMLALPAAFATISTMLYLQGRPEHGIPLVLMVAILLRETLFRGRLSHWFVGLQIGLVAAISPLPGAILGLTGAFLLCLETASLRSLLVGLLVRVFCSVLVWMSVTSLVYDGSLTELAVNTARGGAVVLNSFDLSWIPAFWFHQPLVPWSGLLFSLAFLGGLGFLLFRLRSDYRSGTTWIAVLLALPLAHILFTIAIGFSATNYSFLPFLPSVVVWLLGLARALSGSAPRTTASVFPERGKAAAVWLPGMIVLATAATGTGFFKAALLQYPVSLSGPRLDQAEERIAKLRDSLGPGRVILIDGYGNARSAVVFDAPPWRCRGSLGDSKLAELESGLGVQADYYLTLQSSAEPPERPGFTLAENHYSQEPVLFAGQVRLWFTPGYGYALYRRSCDEKNAEP